MDEKPEATTRDLRSLDGGFGSSGRDRSISLDTILSAVANDLRRAILDVVTSASEKTLEYDELVDRVADRVQYEDPAWGSDEHRQRVSIAVRHTHLPTLEDARLLDYDAEMGQVQFVGGELEQQILTLVEPYE